MTARDTRLAANELRRVFGIVPQETVPFSGTLYQNPVMAHPQASFDDDVVAACKAAELFPRTIKPAQEQGDDALHHASDSEGFAS